EADYANAARLRDRFQRFASEHQLEDNNAANYVRTLAAALHSVGRQRQAALVLECFVPLAEADYANAARLRDRLQRFASERGLSGNNAAIYMQTLATVLGSVSRWPQAALVLEGFVPLEEADYADTVALRRCLQRFASE